MMKNITIIFTSSEERRKKFKMAAAFKDETMATALNRMVDEYILEVENKIEDNRKKQELLDSYKGQPVIPLPE